MTALWATPGCLYRLCRLVSFSCVVFGSCMWADGDAHVAGKPKHQKQKLHVDRPNVTRRKLEKACGQTHTLWQTVQVAEQLMFRTLHLDITSVSAVA